MPQSGTPFDRTEFLGQFSGALRHIGEASKFGEIFAVEGFQRIIFAGCGAPHHMARLLAYWGHRSAVRTEISVYYASELVSQDPAAIDDKTLVVLGSHSGTTRETIEAAAYLKNKPCKTVGITQAADSPLGIAVDHALVYGGSSQGYFSAYILAQTMFSAFMNAREKNWDCHAALMDSLPNLPAALAEAKMANLIRAANQAKRLSGKDFLFVLGAGPMATTAYVFAACFLMEMQWMHAHALTAADFFHGPFEVVDKTTSVITLIGEDPSRLEGERLKRFCEKYAGTSFIYDSMDYDMRGIQTAARPILAPFIIDAALTSLVEELAVLRAHPLTARRYMGKVTY